VHVFGGWCGIYTGINHFSPNFGWKLTLKAKLRPDFSFKLYLQPLSSVTSLFPSIRH